VVGAPPDELTETELAELLSAGRFTL